MAKLGKLFAFPIATPSFRIDSVDRMDFVGAIVNDGHEAAWFEESSQMWKDYDYKKLEKTDEGYLIGRAVATTIGVFPYRQTDGSIRNELRAPQEVYHPDSLESLKLAPITNDHPVGVAVTADNVKELGVGTVGENIDADMFHGFVSVPISIQQVDAVGDVEGGKRGLSCGYTTDVIEKSGVWGGMRYDAIQTNIKYNHLAIVDAGRAGDAAVLKMDGAMITIEINDPALPPKDDGKSKKKKSKKDNQTKPTTGGKMKFRLDGYDVEADDRVKNHLDVAVQSAKDAEAGKLTADEALVTAQTEKSELQAKHDALETSNKDLQTKLDASIPADKIAEHVASIKKMDDAIAKSGAVVKEDASELDKKKAVVCAFNKDLSLDGKDEAYVNVSFDIVCADMAKLDVADANNALLLTPTPAPAPTVDAAIPELTPEQKYDERVRNAHKQGDK